MSWSRRPTMSGTLCSAIIGCSRWLPTIAGSPRDSFFELFLCRLAEIAIPVKPIILRIEPRVVAPTHPLAKRPHQLCFDRRVLRAVGDVCQLIRVGSDLIQFLSRSP